MLVIVYVLFIIAFFCNNLVQLNIIPPYIPWITEPLIYFFFCLSLIISKARICLPFIGYFAMFFVAGVASAVVNGNLGLNTLLGMRLVFRFYLFFLAMVNADFSEEQLIKINKFIVFIFLIQIPFTVVKLFIYGQGESAGGTYAKADGDSVVFITLMCVGFAMAFYLYYKPSWKYIFAALAFTALSIIGEKRSIVFFMPLLVVYLIFNTFKDSKMIRTKTPKFTFKIVLLSIFIGLITVVTGARLMDTLTPERKVGGSFSIEHLINYASEYTNSRNSINEKYTAGRYSTTKQVFSVLYQKGLARAFFGYGPGTYGESRFKDERVRFQSPIFRDIFIQYGVVPLNYTAMEYGFLGVFIYVLFMISMYRFLYKNWRYPQDDYWKAVSFGSLIFGFVYVLIWMTYSMQVFIGDYLPLLFFYLLGQSVIRRNKLERQSMQRESLHP